MTGQLDIGENCAVCGLSLDDHWLATCPENADCANPVTWDEEPVYSPATVAEGLFDGGAFEQMKGQMAMPDATASYVSMLGTEYAGYRVVDRMSGETMSGPYPRYVDAFNAARKAGSRAMAVQL